MHSKMIKFIIQLHHAMHGEWRNAAKYPYVS